MNYKSVKLPSLIAGIFLLTMSACVKDRNAQATDFSNLQPLVEIRDNISGVGNDAGLANFGKATLNFDADPDTVSFYVNLASVNVLDHDVTVTVDVSQDALDAYNADPAHTIKYEMMPDSLYTFLKKDVVIKAGERVDNVSIELYPSKIDPSKSYMLPVSITDAQGINISGNFGTIYYHILGNPLAGNYNWDFTRWGNPQQSGDPDITFTDVTTFFPTSTTSFEVQSGYYIGPRYEVSFTDNGGGNLTDFQVTMNQDDLDAMAGAGVIVTDGPNIIIADPVNKVFEFQYKTLTRYVIDKYYK